MKKILLFALLAPFFARAQDRVQLDSLLGMLAIAPEDTSRAELLDRISFSYSRVDPDKGLEYGQQAKALAESLGWKKGIAAASSDLGINYEAKSIHAQAIHHHLEALRLYEELGMKRSTAGVLANLSLVYRARGDYPSALSYAFRALEIEEEIGGKNIAIIRESIGTIYLRQKNYESAMVYYTAALKVQEAAGNTEGVTRALGNIGIIYDATGDYARALDCHSRALKANRTQGDRNGEQINLMNIGIVHCHMKDFARALDYQVQALQISEELGKKSSIAVNLGNIGETYFFIAGDSSSSTPAGKLVPQSKTANLQLAISYLERSTALCKEIDFLGPLIEFDQFLSDAYLLSGDHRKAFAAFREMTTTRDSVYSQESLIRMNDLETQRVLDLKEKELEIHNKQMEIATLEAANKRKERLVYLSGILLLLVVVGVVAGRFRQRSKVHKAVLSDIASIQSHEIRGSVARMLGLTQLLTRQDPADASNKQLIGYIRDVSVELDENIRRVVTKTTGDDPKDPLPPGKHISYHVFRRSNDKPGENRFGAPDISRDQFDPRCVN
jgi:tetratricopeptide (TPR) repeat protein